MNLGWINTSNKSCILDSSRRRSGSLNMHSVDINPGPLDMDALKLVGILEEELVTRLACVDWVQDPRFHQRPLPQAAAIVSRHFWCGCSDLQPRFWPGFEWIVPIYIWCIFHSPGGFERTAEGAQRSVDSCYERKDGRVWCDNGSPVRELFLSWLLLACTISVRGVRDINLETGYHFQTRWLILIKPRCKMHLFSALQ
jgi:hypothetical protein